MESIIFFRNSHPCRQFGLKNCLRSYMKKIPLSRMVWISFIFSSLSVSAQGQQHELALGSGRHAFAPGDSPNTFAPGDSPRTFALGDSLHTFALGDSAFLLDGKPLQIISGEMHCARVPRAYWHERMKMAKAMGLNAIGTYVFW